MKSATQIFQQSLTLNSKATTTTGLELTFKDTSRKANRPNIRKPYEYLCLTDHKPFVKKLRDLLKPLVGTKLQCQITEAAGKVHGYRLQIWALSNAYDNSTNNTMSYSGIIEADWNALIETVQNEIHNFLGPDALLYAEPWTKARKFEFRFETYAMNHK